MSFERGTVDLKKDPWDGSVMQRMGIPRAIAGSVERYFTYTVRALLPAQMRVQDLLAYVRIPFDAKNNPAEQRYRDRVRSPATAIRAYCVTCTGSAHSSWHCDKIECPLWPFHRGKSSLRPTGTNK